MKEISSINQLHTVVYRDVFVSLVSKIPDYKLALPSESEDKNNQISNLLNRYKNECGCFIGGLSMGISVIVITSYFVMSEATFLDLDLSAMIVVVGIVFASSIIGKVVGLVWAKVQMFRTVRRIVFSVDNE